MKTRIIQVERITITSSKPFADVLKKLEAAAGHPEMNPFHMDITAAPSEGQMEAVVNQAVGSSGLMLFLRLDMGEFLRKREGGKGAQSLRLLIGNPPIMIQMARHVPDAAAYAPVTILMDERLDGVYLSYDRMASFLVPYGSLEAVQVAKGLDAKVTALLEEAAQ